MFQDARSLFFDVIIFALLFNSHQACFPCYFYGNQTTIREFPFFATLDECGATILADKWLVTAAHCVDKPSLNPDKKVWIGGETTSNSQEITYKKVVMHPQYNVIFKHIPINDIALLELSEKLTFSDKIKSIEIAGDSNGEDLLFVGKGSDENGRDSTSIKQLELKQLTPQQCLEEMPPRIQLMVKPYLKHLEKMNICARTENYYGVCLGDSGSPLIHNNQLVGLASYVGKEDCRKARLNFFTNLPTYAHWINSVTGLK